jgi:hypothetical protein
MPPTEAANTITRLSKPRVAPWASMRSAGPKPTSMAFGQELCFRRCFATSSVAFSPAGGFGTPMQVVKPSVSRANLEQGTAGTVMVETPSFPVLLSPVWVRVITGLPPGRTTPAGAGVTAVADGAGVGATGLGSDVWATAGARTRLDTIARETANLFIGCSVCLSPNATPFALVRTRRHATKPVKSKIHAPSASHQGLVG